MKKNSKNEGVDLRHSYISLSGNDIMFMMAAIVLWLGFLSINVYFS